MELRPSMRRGWQGCGLCPGWGEQSRWTRQEQGSPFQATSALLDLGLPRDLRRHSLPLERVDEPEGPLLALAPALQSGTM